MDCTVMNEGKAPQNNIVAIDLPHEKTTFMQVNDMIFQLHFVLMAYIYTEALGTDDMRFVLILIHLFILIIICATVLKHPPGDGGLLQIVIMMVMACPVCVLLMLLISTITALIVFILWAVVIYTVVASRWNEIVEQMREIRTAVANNKF